MLDTKMFWWCKFFCYFFTWTCEYITSFCACTLVPIAFSSDICTTCSSSFCRCTRSCPLSVTITTCGITSTPVAPRLPGCINCQRKEFDDSYSWYELFGACFSYLLTEVSLCTTKDFGKIMPNYQNIQLIWHYNSKSIILPGQVNTLQASVFVF